MLLTRYYQKIKDRGNNEKMNESSDELLKYRWDENVEVQNINMQDKTVTLTNGFVLIIRNGMNDSLTSGMPGSLVKALFLFSMNICLHVAEVINMHNW